MRQNLLGLTTLAWVSAPGQALACAVCMDDEAANRAAYIAMTFLLTVLPFIIVGSLGYYIWRKGQEAEGEPL
jgi:hypothetical protein